MRKYRVTINNAVYEVEVEELTTPTSVGSAPAASAPSAAAPAGVEQITAPMPGTILAVNVSVGDVVKRGDILVVLEAMKMENEIMAPRDGRVVSVDTAKGANVDSGALLCMIR